MVAEHGSTKVYYHLDDSTPYMSIVPVSYEKITLGDFKKVFTRRGYNYFCKEYDADLQREVKVEITSDVQKLHKSANGLIELFLLSQNLSSSLASDTLPRAKMTSSKTINCSMSKFKLNKRRSSAHALSSIADEMDIGGGQRVSMVTNERSISGEASSDINTLVSKRAGEHLAELYTSISEDPYKLYGITEDCNNDNSSSTIMHNNKNSCNNYFSQTTRQRKPRKQRYRKPYVPSTISSASESSLSFSLPRVDEIQIRLQDAPMLGIAVACHEGGVFISKIQPGSAAEKCGRLEVGDQIVQIEHVSFENLSDEQAVLELRKASLLNRTITIYVAKRPRISDQKSDALSLLCETMQMDISLWVEQTTKQDTAEKMSPFNDLLNIPANSQDDSLRKNVTNNEIINFNSNVTNNIKNYNNFGNETSVVPQTSNLVSLHENSDNVLTSDEERAAYADRRNGVGSRLVPALQNKKRAAAVEAANAQQKQMIFQTHHNLQPKVVLPSMPSRTTHKCSMNVPVSQETGIIQSNGGALVYHKENLINDVQEPLNINMDPIVILKAMAKPNSGLVIKNRKWLKIPVLNSFIGDEMINWLLQNVNGFGDKKSAKAYASVLLANGYIKHVVNMSHFNEKCYYIFEDFIIDERLRLMQQQQVSSSTLASSITTASTTTRVSGVNAPNVNNENKTEVTYMSSPSSPFLKNNTNTGIGTQVTLGALNQATLNRGPTNVLVKVANNPRYISSSTQLNMNKMIMRKNNNVNIKDNNNNTSQKHNNILVPASTSSVIDTSLIVRNPNTSWPISPIQLYSNGHTNTAIRKCESPAATNDYASMIQEDVEGQFEHFDNTNLKLKENNAALLSSLPSAALTNLNITSNKHSDCLLPSVPPPAPNQRLMPTLSKNLY